MGQLYLSNVDFLKNGVPASMIATFVRAVSFSFSISPLSQRRQQVVSTVGYVLMTMIGYVPCPDRLFDCADTLSPSHRL